MAPHVLPPGSMRRWSCSVGASNGRGTGGRWGRDRILSSPGSDEGERWVGEQGRIPLLGISQRGRLLHSVSRLHGPLIRGEDPTPLRRCVRHGKHPGSTRGGGSLLLAV